MTDSLISRLEQAEAGSRELDAEVFKAIGAPLPSNFGGRKLEFVECGGFWLMPVGNGHRVRYTPPAYTTSLDAAMSLIPEGWNYCITPRNGVWVRQSEHFPTIHGSAATPALALCIAALKASHGRP